MSTQSQIDPTVIRDDQKVQKSDLREQLQIAASEITTLNKKVSIPWRYMTDDTQWTSL